jgi:LacI family transcriptional regulator
VVLSRPFRHDARIELLQASKFPFVVHGRSASCDSYAWYDIDNELAFKTAATYLIELGHRRIGFIGAPLYFNFAHQRLQGYRAGLSAFDIPYDESLVQISELTDDAGERAAADLLNTDNPPTAFLCVSDTQAFGVLAAVRARGLVAGTDVSVVGYDGLKTGRHTNPPLTTMSQPLAQSGRELGDMLLAIIDGDDPTSHQILKRAKLLVRNSDGPLWTKHQ